MDIAVIGGGAAGLISAVFAKRENEKAEVSVYERLDRVGKKILATGNGRCNFCNVSYTVDNYHGEDPSFVLPALSQFGPDEIMGFFKELGIYPVVEEGGKVFPRSGQASSILDCLREECRRLGVLEICNFDVAKITPQDGGFVLETQDGKKARCDKVIIACGGKATPSLGSNGGGYYILSALGYKITKLYPALVQIKTDPTYVKAMNGIKVNVTARAICNNEILDVQKGELLFTLNGMSGPTIFNLSRHASKENLVISIDLADEFSQDELISYLIYRKELLPYKKLDGYLAGFLHKKVGHTLLKAAGVLPYDRMVSTLSGEEIMRMARLMKDWRFKVLGTMGFQNAQVTIGGVKTKDFDKYTMESKKHKGLYACGEVLDIDGDCGGYNLMWAWASGALAGKNAAKGQDRV